MKKTLKIIMFILFIILILGLSIYLPNKDKINEEVEDKSIIYSVIEENGKYGVKNQNNETIIQINYDKIVIPNQHRAVFFCYNGEQKTILNNRNETIFEEYDSVDLIKLDNISEDMYEKDALIYKKNEQYGLLSITGNVILEAKYEDIYSLGYKENEIIVKDNNKYMIYDTKGRNLIKDVFDSIESDEFYTEEDEYRKSGYIVCKITSDGYRYGYYDYEYNKVLDIEYNQIARIIDVKNKNNIYLIASLNGQFGVFINNTKVIDTQYQSINYDSDLEIFIVERTGNYGAFNENGTEILNTEYNSLIIQGLYLYGEKESEQKVYDKNGKEVNIPFTTIIEPTEMSQYYIKIENNKYGIVNDKNETIINCEYDLIQQISGTNTFQGIKNENDITTIFNKNLENVFEMVHATTEVLEDKIKVYNESEEVNFDFDGNKIQ